MYLEQQFYDTVYKFRVYDITTDQFQTSRRMATGEWIKKIGGVIVAETGVRINRKLLAEGEQYTERDFKPDSAAA